MSANVPDRKAETARSIVWKCARNGLLQGVTRRIETVARLYHRETGTALRVVSARRSLQRQAELMAAMSQEQLEILYCRNGYPDYVRQIADGLRACGTVSPAKVYEILAQRAEGYVSAHLSGAALDIDATDADVDLLHKLLTENGFRVLDERVAGIPCIHAVIASAKLRMVRK